MQNYTAIIYKEDDIYVSECLELDIASQGETVEEALKNLREATELYLEASHEDGPTSINSPALVTVYQVNNA